MVKTSNVVLELPKRTAILLDDRPHAARSKVRGLFWLTLATVVLGLVVVLASLWKTFATPSVPAPSPAMVTTVAAPPPPVATCNAPAPHVEPEVVTTSIDVIEGSEPDAGSGAAPAGFPSLDQFP